MFFLHPTAALVAALVVVWVYALGLKRFAAKRLHLHQRFNRRLHMRLGAAAVALLILAAGSGMLAAERWGVGMPESHARGAAAVVAFAALAGLSGAALRARYGGSFAAAVHGVAGTLLVLACFFQIAVGVPILYSAL